MKRTIVAIGIAATVLLVGVPANAFQTEVDAGTMEWKRAGLAKFHRRVAREERLAAAAAAALAEEAAAAASTPATAPSYSSYSGGVLSATQVAAFARGAGFPESVIPTMVDIAWGESRFNPEATNPDSGACGLWQLYPCPGSHAYNPATNAALAYAKYSNGGLSHWGY